MVILGQAYEFGTDDFTEGIDYIKVLNLSDGTTKLLFLQLYPEDIYHLVAVPGKGVLIGIDKWLVLWDAVDPDVVRWRVRMDTPAYLTVMGNDRFLVVGRDLRSLFLFNLDGYKQEATVRTGEAIMGLPVLIDGIIYIPVTNGVIRFSSALVQIDKILVPNLKKEAKISANAAILYISDGFSISRIAI